MLIAKQMDIRANIKKYFDLAHDGEVILVPRKGSKNIVIISEEEYSKARQMGRLTAYALDITEAKAHKVKPTRNSIKSDNLKKLDSIGNLSDNWNGNGATAIPTIVIDKTRKIIEEIPIQPEIFPTALSTIQLEFYNSRRDHMEIEIGASESVEIFIVDYYGSKKIERIFDDVETIAEKVLQFYG